MRESYLAALETEDFAVLGGDVYVRGFIRLYARYLGLDAEELVEVYRTEHEKPEEITAIPGATLDDILPDTQGLRALQTPVLAAVGIVLLLVALFIFGRSRSQSADEVDPDAPGPVPTDVASDDAVPDPLATDGQIGTEAPIALPPSDAEPLTGPLTVEVIPARDVRIRVLEGQPPVDATLAVGQGRVITHDARIVLQIGDATAAEIRVNGGALVNLGADGQAVEISCAVGAIGCDVRDV